MRISTNGKHTETLFQCLTWTTLSSEIVDFVHRCIPSKDVRSDPWRFVTHSRGMAGAVADFIAKSNDAEVPYTDKKRDAWSFKKHVYLGDTNQCFPYGDPDLPSSLETAKCFPEEFDDEEYEQQMGEYMKT